TRQARISGTPWYMAPECFSPGSPPTTSSDLYSLGCLAFELLTGTGPFPGATTDEIRQRHQSSPIPRAAAFRPQLAPIQPLFERLLAKSPIDRPGAPPVVGHL